MKLEPAGISLTRMLEIEPTVLNARSQNLSEALHSSPFFSQPPPIPHPGVIHGIVSDVTCETLTGTASSDTIAYRIELHLPTPVHLVPGVYHLEIFNDTLTRGCFTWIEGGADPGGGSLAGFFTSDDAPGAVWTFQRAERNQSLQLFEGLSIVEIPTLNGAALFALAAAIAVASMLLISGRS